MRKKILFFTLIFSQIFTSVFSLQQVWNAKAGFPGSSVYAPVSFSVNGRAYVGIGFNGVTNKDFWEYDPNLDTWAQMADFSGSARFHSTSLSINNKGYIGLGSETYPSYTFKNDFWEYDPVINTWVQKSSFPGTERYGAIGFSIGSKAYVGTGWDQVMPYFKDFWEYDQPTDTWTQKADFGGSARVSAVGFSLNGKGYVGCGWDPGTTNDFWEYSPITDSWLQIADFPGSPRYGAASFVINNEAYVGTGTDGNIYFTDFYKYNTQNSVWQETSSFCGQGRRTSAFFTIDNYGYIGNGANASGNLNDFWKYGDTLKADFTFFPAIINPGDTVFYTNNSSGANSFLWNFGDGNTSNEISPFHIFFNCGTFSLTLIADNGNCGSDTTVQNIIVNGSPSSAFSFSSVPCLNSTTNFINNSTGATSYFWNFGDGNMSSLVSPTHSYSDTGDFDVFLVATSSCGSDTSFQTISVNGGPKADFSMTPDSCGTSKVVLFNSSSGATSYFWNFGDGDTSTSVNPSHTYSSAGTFNILLVSFNSCGNDSSYQSLVVNSGLTSIFSAPDISCINTLINFINNSTEGTSYLWDFGNGDTSSLFSPTHSYSDSGLFDVVLVAYGPCGTDSAFHSIFVSGSAIAAFSALAVSCMNNLISFTNNSIGATSYYWNFGDGDTSSLISPNHSYSDSGLFEIFLLATNSCGTDTFVSSVLSSPKEFPYTISEDTAIDAGSQILLAISQGLAYSWNTGETTNEIAVSPTAETIYYVTITDASGCIAVDSVNVKILACSIFIPTIFSPNGDGRNDKISVHTKSIREFNFYIYDRWGEQVFESHDSNFGWDGMFSTELINTAVFVYYIEATCKNDEVIRERGNITLIR